MGEEPNGIIGWVLAGVSAVIAFLASVIGVQYKLQVGSYETRIALMEVEIEKGKKESEECARGRNAIEIEHAVLKEKYSTLESRVSDLEENKANRETLNRKIDELKS